MAEDKTVKVTKYDPLFHDIFTSLQNGLIHLCKFLADLNQTVTDDVLQYIKDILEPSVEKAGVEFKGMIEQADVLLQEVNTDLEGTVSKMKTKKDKLKEMEQSLQQLEVELKRTEKAEQDAEKQIQFKEKSLANAKSALSSARDKLHNAKATRKVTKILGAVILGPLIIPVDKALLEKNVNSCQSVVDSALGELRSSQTALADAKNNKATVLHRISDLKEQIKHKEELLDEMSKGVDELKKYQTRIIAFNENIQRFDRNLSDFVGKFNVLKNETTGGYSTSLLKSPALSVYSSLTDLVESDVVRDKCDSAQLTSIESQMHAISIVCSCMQTTSQSGDHFGDLI